MTLFGHIQTWAADHGYGQYPIPRRTPPSHLGLRLVIGTISLFALAVLIPLFGAELVVIIVAIKVALGS